MTTLRQRFAAFRARRNAKFLTHWQKERGVGMWGFVVRRFSIIAGVGALGHLAVRYWRGEPVDLSVLGALFVGYGIGAVIGGPIGWGVMEGRYRRLKAEEAMRAFD